MFFYFFYFILFFFFFFYSVSSAKHAADMRKKRKFRSPLSSEPLHSIHTFSSIEWICKWTVNALTRLCGCAGWPGLSLSAFFQRRVFARRGHIHFNSTLIRHLHYENMPIQIYRKKKKEKIQIKKNLIFFIFPLKT